MMFHLAWEPHAGISPKLHWSLILNLLTLIFTADTSADVVYWHQNIVPSSRPSVNPNNFLHSLHSLQQLIKISSSSRDKVRAVQQHSKAEDTF